MFQEGKGGHGMVPTIIFEKKLIRVIVTLDPAKGSHYTEPVHDYESEDDQDCIYKITVRDQYWVNPTADG